MQGAQVGSGIGQQARTALSGHASSIWMFYKAQPNAASAQPPPPVLRHLGALRLARVAHRHLPRFRPAAVHQKRREDLVAARVQPVEMQARGVLRRRAAAHARPTWHRSKLAARHQQHLRRLHSTPRAGYEPRLGTVWNSTGMASSAPPPSWKGSLRGPLTGQDPVSFYHPLRNPFNLNLFDSAQCLMVRRWRLIGYFPILTVFDSAQCLMVRRWRLIGHFPILYNPLREEGVEGGETGLFST
jgi:hypothetical protein